MLLHNRSQQVMFYCCTCKKVKEKMPRAVKVGVSSFFQVLIKRNFRQRKKEVVMIILIHFLTYFIFIVFLQNVMFIILEWHSNLLAEQLLNIILYFHLITMWAYLYHIFLPLYMNRNRIWQEPVHMN